MSSLSPPDDSTPSASDVIEDAAIAWLTERDDGFSPARERAFSIWLRSDPRHAAAITRLEQTLGILNELPQFRAELNTAFNRAASVVPFVPSTEGSRASVGKLGRRVFMWIGVAAMIVFGVAMGLRVFQSPDGNRYATPVSSYERARLNDGSTLELNAASAVLVQFTPAERRVELESGEAQFSVAHDVTRPFVVNAGGVSVRAVGTVFNVRYTPAGVEVIVVEGKVRVGQAGPDSSASQEAPLVAAGERMRLLKQAATPIAEKISPDELRVALAWQGRLVDFAEVPLAEAVVRFNVLNRIQLVLADVELGTRRIGGTFALDEPEAFVRLLEREGVLVAERRGEAEIVLQRTR